MFTEWNKEVFGQYHQWHINIISSQTNNTVLNNQQTGAFHLKVKLQKSYYETIQSLLSLTYLLKSHRGPEWVLPYGKALHWAAHFRCTLGGTLLHTVPQVHKLGLALTSVGGVMADRVGRVRLENRC